jgi:Ca2+-binding EF-hand superfamily protein
LLECRKKQQQEEEQVEEQNNDAPELTRMEVEMAKQNFQFYQSQKKSPILELYELPMVLSACGYKVSPEMLDKLQEMLQQSKKTKLDFGTLQMVLTQIKRLELADDPTNDGDEYLDAFVALGGENDKSGKVSKEMLINIIKEEFELTIDMVVSPIS